MIGPGEPRSGVPAGPWAGAPAGPVPGATAGADGAGDDPGGPVPGQAGQAETAPPAEAARADQPGKADGTGRKRGRSFWRELPILIVIALVIALLIKSFVVQPFFIPSSSMENTLKVGDKVLVSKLTYDFRPIEPGDIVVFNGDGSWDPNPPGQPRSRNPVVRLYDATVLRLYHAIIGLFGDAPGQQDYIKRVIGVPGDHVACCNARGQVTVNGIGLNEKSYLYPGNAPGSGEGGHFSITVPPGRLWVMGDHRSVSWDSRGHRSDPGGGTIPESAVVGRAFMIIWPPSRIRILPIPSTFDRPGIDLPRSAAGARATALAGMPRGLPALGGIVGDAAPYLPAEAGFALALPLTWLQRRLRLRRRGRLARPRLRRRR